MVPWKNFKYIIVTCSIIIVILLSYFLLHSKNTTINNNANAFKIYKQEETIYCNNKVLIENVVDYTLTSLDNQKQHLLVLHYDRSSNRDEVGYEKAIQEKHNIGGYLRFYELSTQSNKLEAKLIYENDFTLINPWCIEAGNMDCDGYLDIFVGAYRATEVYEADRRPFMFEWKNDQLERFWTGSYLNLRTFYEAGFEDMNQDGFDELYAIQPNKEGGLTKFYYKKGTFTFIQVGEVDVKN